VLVGGLVRKCAQPALALVIATMSPESVMRAINQLQRGAEVAALVEPLPQCTEIADREGVGPQIAAFEPLRGETGA